MLQTQEQKKSLETKSNEKEISDLPQKEYKIMVIKISKSGEYEKKKKKKNFDKENILKCTKQKS